MTLTKWDTRFIILADYIAQWSKDPNTKIGAVVVHDQTRQILSTGYNGMARGVDDDVPERSSREEGEKYYWYGHGERNAIYNAARYGIRLVDSSIYLNCGVPCCDCAIAIIQAGVKKVVCKTGNPTGVTNSKWDAHATRSKVMFAEAGVEIQYY